ncbi:hypothetical protein AYO21_06542 [Fonsecaea monophora]|uniref:GST N-terminal domain-containing protein n=1 Tax=Fonsecaea monophora TaxID=254056 RepID=A0A177F737_9EURO|nr:hypothetical protein AYO21_06542 [Fonsecaea monophora]OAG39159.1 hypothetical protein AYO21_06542 [Fonsecaea monophora]
MQDQKPTALFKIYSSTASQWAGVPLLGLVEKGYPEGSYEVDNIDLMADDDVGKPVNGGNFHPDYVAINPNGTIPSLTSPVLPAPLVESADILVYLDEGRPEGITLSPGKKGGDVDVVDKVKEVIDLVHSPQLSTNIILLDARDRDELKAKQASPFRDFLAARQAALDGYAAQFPDSDFYRSRRDMNHAIYRHYYLDGDDHQDFFDQSRADYRGFAAGVAQLDATLVLPYAAGPDLTLADLHVVPWLAHAMWGAGSERIDDFAPLEALVRKTVPEFCVGGKVRAWWANMLQRESVRRVYPRPH